MFTRSAPELTTPLGHPAAAESEPPAARSKETPKSDPTRTRRKVCGARGGAERPAPLLWVGPTAPEPKLGPSLKPHRSHCARVTPQRRQHSARVPRHSKRPSQVCAKEHIQSRHPGCCVPAPAAQKQRAHASASGWPWPAPRTCAGAADSATRPRGGFPGAWTLVVATATGHEAWAKAPQAMSKSPSATAARHRAKSGDALRSPAAAPGSDLQARLARDARAQWDPALCKLHVIWPESVPRVCSLHEEA